MEPEAQIKKDLFPRKPNPKPWLVGGSRAGGIQKYKLQLWGLASVAKSSRILDHGICLEVQLLILGSCLSLVEKKVTID